MKLISFFVLCLTVFLVSCSKPGGSSVEFKVTIAGLAGFAQPVMFFAKNNSTGQRVAQKFANGSDVLQLDLPNGSWKFSLIVWSGTNPLEGHARCFTRDYTLSGVPVLVNAELTRGNCSHAIFGGEVSFSAAEGFRPVSFNNCSQLDHVTSSSSLCNLQMRGYARSFKLGLLQFNEASGGAKTIAFESGCIDGDVALGRIATALRLPASTGEGVFQFSIKSYAQHACTGSMRTQLFTDAQEGTNLRFYANTNSTELYTTTFGPHKTVQLITSSSAGCDYTPKFLPTQVGQSTILLGMPGGGGQSPLIRAATIASNSASRVLPIETNPSGEESVSSIVIVGGKSYFVVSAPNNFTFQLYSFDGVSTNHLTTGAIVTNGVDFSNRAGVMTNLIVHGSDIYFGFKSEPASNQDLCRYRTLTAEFDCTVNNSSLTNSFPMNATANAFFYYATDGTNLGIWRYNGTHTKLIDLTANSMTEIYSSQSYNGPDVQASYISGTGGQWLIAFINDQAIFRSSSVGFSSNGPINFLGPINAFIDGGRPHINFNSPVSIETQASLPMGASPTTEILGHITPYLYFSLNPSSGNQNIYAFNTLTNSVIKITNFTGTFSVSSAILNNTLYFIRNYVDSIQLSKISGETMTVVKTVNASSGGYAYLKAAGSKLFISTSDGVSGTEPWISDGTENGTFMLKDISAGASDSYPVYVSHLNDTVFFRTSGTLWRTNGTPEGTVVEMAETGLNVYTISVSALPSGGFCFHTENYSNSSFGTSAIVPNP